VPEGRLARRLRARTELANAGTCLLPPERGTSDTYGAMSPNVQPLTERPTMTREHRELDSLAEVYLASDEDDLEELMDGEAEDLEDDGWDDDDWEEDDDDDNWDDEDWEDEWEDEEDEWD